MNSNLTSLKPQNGGITPINNENLSIEQNTTSMKSSNKNRNLGTNNSKLYNTAITAKSSIHNANWAGLLFNSKIPHEIRLNDSISNLGLYSKPTSDGIHGNCVSHKVLLSHAEYNKVYYAKDKKIWVYCHNLSGEKWTNGWICINQHLLYDFDLPSFDAQEWTPFYYEVDPVEFICNHKLIGTDQTESKKINTPVTKSELTPPLDYQLVHDIHFYHDGKVHQIQVKPLRVQNILQFMSKGHREGSMPISGLIGSTYNVNMSTVGGQIPRGYRPASANVSITLSKRFISHRINIVLDSAQVEPLTINYYNQHGQQAGQQFIKSTTLANMGLIGSQVNVTDKLNIPKSYHLLNSQSEVTTTIQFKGHPSTMNLYIMGDEIPFQINYLDQTNYRITINGKRRVGDTIDFNKLLPKGYHLNRNQKESDTLTPSSNEWLVKMIGNQITKVLKLKATRDYAGDTLVNKSITGHVGDIVNINPKELDTSSIGHGYNLDLKHSKNLYKGKIIVKLGADKYYWLHHNAPVLHYSAKPVTIHVKYYDQNDICLDHADNKFVGHVNQTINFNNNLKDLDLPKDYEYDTYPYRNHPYKCSADKNQNAKIYLRGRDAKLNLQFVNQNNVKVLSKVITGSIGNRAKASDYIPQGYKFGENKKTSFTFSSTPSTYKINVKGVPVAYNATVKVVKENAPTESITLELRGDVGDNATGNPDVDSTGGYSLNLDKCQHLVHNKLEAHMDANKFTWLDHNKAPVIYYCSLPQQLPIQYITSDGKKVSHEYLHGRVNENLALYSMKFGVKHLNIPKGYQYIPDPSYNIVKFVLNASPIQIKIRGNVVSRRIQLHLIKLHASNKGLQYDDIIKPMRIHGIIGSQVMINPNKIAPKGYSNLSKPLSVQITAKGVNAQKIVFMYVNGIPNEHIDSKIIQAFSSFKDSHTSGRLGLIESLDQIPLNTFALYKGEMVARVRSSAHSQDFTPIRSLWTHYDLPFALNNLRSHLSASYQGKLPVVKEFLEFTKKNYVVSRIETRINGRNCFVKGGSDNVKYFISEQRNLKKSKNPIKSSKS